MMCLIFASSSFSNKKIKEEKVSVEKISITPFFSMSIEKQSAELSTSANILSVSDFFACNFLMISFMRLMSDVSVAKTTAYSTEKSMLNKKLL